MIAPKIDTDERANEFFEKSSIAPFIIVIQLLLLFIITQKKVNASS